MCDPQEELKRWLCDRLSVRGRGSARALARHLGISADTVRRMKCVDGGKERRTVPSHLLPGIAEFLNEWPPGFEPLGIDVDRLAEVIRLFDKRFPHGVPLRLKAACIAALYRPSDFSDNWIKGGTDDGTGRE